MRLAEWIKCRRGRAVELARHLCVPASFVSQMASGTKPVPVEQCPAIELFTGREVLCEEMRPDKAAYFATLKTWAANNGPLFEPNSRPAKVKPRGTAMENIANSEALRA